jgi:hypothetical protein
MEIRNQSVALILNLVNEHLFISKAYNSLKAKIEFSGQRERK